MEGLFGRKIGMTQLFAEDGTLIPVTVVSVYPAVLVEQKEYTSGKKKVLIAYGDIKESRIKKPIEGIYKKYGLTPKMYLREVLDLGDIEFNRGKEVGVELLENVEKVDVVGVSKGRGFQGGVKRWNWSIGPKSHGSMSHRVIGSLGPGTDPGRVIKGRHLPGHMGNNRVTVKNLKVVKIDKENNVVWIKGSVPGHIKSTVFVRKAKAVS